MKIRSGLGRSLAVMLALWGGGCVTIGREFPVDPVQQVQIGTTTRADVQRLFGEPWRIGIEDGSRTWTYALYRYSAFGPEQTRDLVVRFDGAGVVRSYSFNSTHPEDAGLVPEAGPQP